MDYASTHKICRVRINFLKECRTKSNNLYRMKRQVRMLWSQFLPQRHRHTTLYLCFSDLCVHRMLCFEDILHFLLRTTKSSMLVLKAMLRPIDHPVRGQSQPLSTHSTALSLAQLLPTLKEILRSHFCGLKKFVERNGQLNRHILEGTTIPITTESCYEEQIPGQNVPVHESSELREWPCGHPSQ